MTTESERPIADVVADLRGPMEPFAWAAYLAEAADLIERLDAASQRSTQDYIWALIKKTVAEAELERLDALRPPCPTCDTARQTLNSWPCPDCVDGRIPFERMAAIARAVVVYVDGPSYTHRAAFAYLRSVKT